MGPGEVAWWEVAVEDNLQTIRLYCDRLDARQDSTSGHPQLSPLPYFNAFSHNLNTNSSSLLHLNSIHS